MRQDNSTNKTAFGANFLVIAIKVIIFVGGIFTLTLGAAALIEANLGVASWDVLHIGLAKRGLSIGTWVQIIGIFMILLASALERKQPKLGSAVNIILIGFSLNWILDGHILPVTNTLWTSIFKLLSGVVLMGLGSGMYVATELGAGPRDGLTLVLSKMWGRSVRLVRTMLEMTALLCGWIAGGPISVGTFVAVFLIGPIMQASLYFWRQRIEEIENFLLQDVLEEEIG